MTPSATQVYATALAAWRRQHRPTCGCARELRLENGTLSCARCGAPIALVRAA